MTHSAHALLNALIPAAYAVVNTAEDSECPSYASACIHSDIHDNQEALRHGWTGSDRPRMRALNDSE